MANNKNRDTLEQLRQRHAYEQIMSGPKNLEKLCARVQGLPVEVRVRGLGVAVATLIKEARSESNTLADWLANWLLKESPLVQQFEGNIEPQSAHRRGLLEFSTKCGRDEYLALQAEALAYLEHVKRLLSAFKKGGFL